MLRLDRDRKLLFDDECRVFDPPSRQWRSSVVAVGGEDVALPDAVRWLQKESGMPCRVPVGVIGPRDATAHQETVAEEVGAALADLGLTLLCGGRGGVMEAACRGAASGGGLSIGILPDHDWTTANPFVTVPIATGIGEARNAINAQASLCLIAVGSGMGTLSEVAFGLKIGRPVFGLPDAPAVDGVVACKDWPELEPHLCRLVLAL